MFGHKQSWKILSVGGSIIIPKTGFNPEFLQQFRQLVREEIERGEHLILMIGGGATARNYQGIARTVEPTLTKEDLDWIGIQSTILNAHLVRFLFKDIAHPEVVTDPTKKVKTKAPLIIGAAWKPGCSTDNDAVLLAKTYGVKEVLNLSNIEYVYTKDPNKFPDAKKIESIDWTTFRREIVGDTWDAGQNAPFDPIASKTAEQLKLTVKILQGTNLSEVQKAIRGEQFIGTIIHP